MRRLLLVLLALSVPLAAANGRLYLKDGSFQVVREYKVDGDRVKFYSVERSEWEEIPLALVDMKRTDAAAAAVKEQMDKLAQEEEDEKEAAREAKAEIHKIPQDPGLYMLDDKGQLRIFSEVDSVVHNDKGRNILRGLSPIPLITGRATLEINGEHSANVITHDRPEFFLQLANFESFAMVKVTPDKGVRVVEKLTVIPVTKEVQEERASVQVFQKELSDNGLYKIWPQEPLAKGEYAVEEYTEGKMNQKIWDFRVE